MRLRRKLVGALFTHLLGLSLALSAAATQAAAQARGQQFSSGNMPEPRVADPERGRKLAAAFPEIERLFLARVEQAHMPGAAIGRIGWFTGTRAAG